MQAKTCKIIAQKNYKKTFHKAVLRIIVSAWTRNPMKNFSPKLVRNSIAQATEAHCRWIGCQIMNYPDLSRPGISYKPKSKPFLWLNCIDYDAVKFRCGVLVQCRWRWRRKSKQTAIDSHHPFRFLWLGALIPRAQQLIAIMAWNSFCNFRNISMVCWLVAETFPSRASRGALSEFLPALSVFMFTCIFLRGQSGGRKSNYYYTGWDDVYGGRKFLPSFIQ